MREYFSNANCLPLVILADSSAEKSCQYLTDWIRHNDSLLRNKLREVGAILFRDFLNPDVLEFQHVLHAFHPEFRAYIGGLAPRHRVIDQIYTSTEYPASETITLHNELAFTSHPPRQLFFFCETPANNGGETPIIDNRLFLKQMSGQVRDAFIERGILYTCRMHGGNGFGKSWQDSFATTKEGIEEQLDETGVEYRWDSENALCIRRTTPAVRRHPDTNELTWFNNASLFHLSGRGETGNMLLGMLGESKLPTHAYFENGEPIPDSLMNDIRALAWRNAQFLAWQPGDLLILDNFLVAHGRNSYSGDRRILVAMA